jgi:hypothetical protein
MPSTEGNVALSFYYLGFMAAGDVAAYLLGSAVEYEFGSHVSLIVFLALYFVFLWIALDIGRVGNKAKIG